jgi:hypothetical protein
MLAVIKGASPKEGGYSGFFVFDANTFSRHLSIGV